MNWRPSPFIWLCVALHLLALLLLWLEPQYWPQLALALLALHGVISLVGLLPRSNWLGANLTRLPVDAVARGEVAITIDDGPDPAVTPQVLAILRRHGATATFFCIGERAAAHPELCRAIGAAGHAIENHGQRHRKHTSAFGPRGWLREVGDAQVTLLGITGSAPLFYRPIAGLRNPFLDPVLQRLGLRLASWTRRGFDTQADDPDKVYAKLARGLSAGDILLLHDGNAACAANGRPVIVDVLPRLLDELAARHLKPVTLRQACKKV